MADTYTSFGAWLSIRRQALLLTQAELAQRVSCAEITIRKIEADERRPSAHMASLLAQHVGLATDEREAFVRAARGLISVEYLPRPHPLALPVDKPPMLYQQPLPGALSLAKLPVLPHAFIGREQELAALRQLLLSRKRLITLVGSGGTGKTSLALESVAELGDVYPDGIFFLDLAALTEAAQLQSSLAVALGLSESTPFDRLGAWIASRQLLIIFDNCEHIIADVASMISSLLKAASQQQIVATSRTPLRVHAEYEYPVLPLPTPNLERQLSLADLEAIPSVALFLIRAQMIDPTFSLNPENAATIAAICVQLEGLPLAIELAAARIRLLSLEQLLQRLMTARIPTLIGGARDVPLRQQTMAAAIDWSFQLLSPVQQDLFIVLGSLSGSWTLAMVEALGSSEMDVPKALEALLEHHLVQRFFIDGELRYRMLGTIREYAQEKACNKT